MYCNSCYAVVFDLSSDYTSYIRSFCNIINCTAADKVAAILYKLVYLAIGATYIHASLLAYTCIFVTVSALTVSVMKEQELLLMV